MENLKKIERLERRIKALQEELYTDELTRVLNRRGLMASLEPLVRTLSFEYSNPQKRKNVVIRALSILFVDIDHFKKVNDTYGHPAGDEVLKAVALALRKNVREIDLVGRYGGEEMIVVLLGADSTEATEVAENLRQKVANHSVVFEGKTIQVTASFGVASLQKNMTTEEILAKADRALYRAKETGRNKVVVGE